MIVNHSKRTWNFKTNESKNSPRRKTKRVEFNNAATDNHF
jgi:hypothetical protein